MAFGGVTPLGYSTPGVAVYDAQHRLIGTEQRACKLRQVQRDSLSLQFPAEVIYADNPFQMMNSRRDSPFVEHPTHSVDSVQIAGAEHDIRSRVSRLWYGTGQMRRENPGKPRNQSGARKYRGARGTAILAQSQNLVETLERGRCFGVVYVPIETRPYNTVAGALRHGLPEVRYPCAVALGILESESSLDQLPRLLCEAPESTVRSRTALWIGKIGSEASIPVLKPQAETD